MSLPADRLPLVTIQAEASVPPVISEGALASLVAHILGEEEVDAPWEMGIQFVDDATMQAAHAEFMGIDEPTDIMTFPYEDDGDDFAGGGSDEADPSTRGGDLIISVDTAAENARAAGWPLEDELRFLVAHGVLHLLGWDDETDRARAAMLARQAELLSSWGESR